MKKKGRAVSRGAVRLRRAAAERGGIGSPSRPPFKQIVKEHKDLPRPRAPYAQVVRAGNLVFMSGAVGRAPDGTLVKDDLKAQFRQALINTRAALAAVGAEPEDVVRITLYLTNMKEKALLDKMREEFFGPDWPAAVAIGVTELASPEYLVEMDAIAVVE
jgi:2-iminobutanoate/2-iminopropanoate deaminase